MRRCKVQELDTIPGFSHRVGVLVGSLHGDGWSVASCKEAAGERSKHSEAGTNGTVGRGDVGGCTQHAVEVHC